MTTRTAGQVPGSETPAASWLGRVLVVEDDEDLRHLLVGEIADQGLDVVQAASAEEAIERLAEEPVDLVVTDLRLPEADGLELLSRTRDMPDPPGVLIVTAFGTIDQAVSALKQGADDFLTKPLDLDQLTVRITRILDHRRLRHEIERYRQALRADDFHGMVGRSRAMRGLFTEIERVSRGHGPVLIQGESGVGKELVARAVHAESSRSEGPFRAINCAGVPEALLESEFFGHEAGAFTGASGSRKGLFQAAEGGTLLLDEIGEMPATLQAKLLRVLQERRVRPVGSDRERPVDVRILAATNTDLEAAVRDGPFREDLFYRLHTFPLRVPPLREREADVDLLAVHFIRRHSARLGRPAPEVSPAVFARLRAHAFPGNVRELENVVERTVTFCEGAVLEAHHLPDLARGSDARPNPGVPGRRDPGSESGGDRFWSGLPSPESGLPTLRELGDWYLSRVLERVGGNKRRAAEILGVARRTLYRRLDDAAKREEE